VTVKPQLTGVHDLIRDNQEKPVLMVTIRGLEYSAFGRALGKLPWYKRILRRLPVHIHLDRFDGVLLSGGPSALNKRIESYFNEGTPLATV